MKIFAAVASVLTGARPPADTIRRDVGLVEKPTPQRDWWDYL